MCYLVDYGLYRVIDCANLYFMPDTIDFEDFRKTSPFVLRVTLPPDTVLKSLGLPTSKMIREGDLVDVLLLSFAQPHLAVFCFSEFFFLIN